MSVILKAYYYICYYIIYMYSNIGFVLYVLGVLSIIIIIGNIGARSDSAAVLQGRGTEFWMITSEGCFLESRFVESR